MIESAIVDVNSALSAMGHPTMPLHLYRQYSLGSSSSS